MARKLTSYILIVLLTVVLTSIFQPLSLLQSAASPALQGNCQTFPATGKTLCDRFLQYWNDHGGLAQQGYPITGTFIETSDLNGQQYEVQYFERAVFEYHPENAAPNDVLLSQLGTFQYQRKYAGNDPSIANPAPPVPIGGQAPAPTAAPVPPPPPPAPPTQPPSGQRCGAVCNDGSTSTATGSGACSHHGGVDHWIYCDVFAPAP